MLEWRNVKYIQVQMKTLNVSNHCIYGQILVCFEMIWSPQSRMALPQDADRSQVRFS